MKFRSITTRMVAAIILLVALVTITFSQMFLFQLKHALIEDFDRQSTSLTENFALNAELGLLLEDQEDLEALGENLLAEESVAEIRIFDRERRALIELKKPQRSGSHLVPFVAPVRLSRQESDLDVFLDQVLTNGKAVELGTVEVMFSQAKLQSVIKRLQLRIYSFAFVGLLVGTVLAYYLSRATLKSVKRLVQASKEIAAGNWEMRVQESGDDEVGQLTRDFNLMARSLVKKRQELEESYHELARQERLAEIGRFSTIVAHEMKNPLGIIRGALNILSKPEGSSATNKTMLRYIDEEVTRLNHLAEEFLEFARPPIPKKETFELRDMIKKAKALTEGGGTSGKEVIVTIAAPDTSHAVCGDRNLLFQALLNLIENSIDACGEQVHIVISLNTNEKGTTLTITDNGPGIRKEDQDQIFEPFFTRKEKGTGLGLSIVRKIVELHNGHIAFEERHKTGACFTIWLPKGPHIGQ